MDVGRLLTAERIFIPFQAESPERALPALRARVYPEGDAGPEPSLHRAGRALIAIRRGSALDTMLLGIVPEGAGIDMATMLPASGGGSGEVRILVLLETRGPAGGDGDPPHELVQALEDPEVEAALLAASDARDVRGIRRLVGARIGDPIRVGDALLPMEYRVYPDTPVAEVMDLMARKALSAVPVVGESMQVVGILTAGDAIRLFLERGVRIQRLPTREVMTRAVLCVTEDQTLEEAARIMVNRNLRQLPVVREGEMVGFLTRESVLRGLHGGVRSP